MAFAKFDFHFIKFNYIILEYLGRLNYIKVSLIKVNSYFKKLNS
jgi:hypothetical protein